jgi:hypothetical protein
MIYIGIPLILLACVAKAISDKLQFHFWTSVFAKWNGYFWNPALSWKRKWKNGDKKQGERFWRSSRQFVIFTDAMHLFNAIYGVLLFTGAAIMGFEIWWLTIGTYIAGKGLFELFFRIILRNE